MTEQELIADHIAKHGVTKCPPVIAQGAVTNQRSRRAVIRKRRQWRNSQEAKCLATQ